MTKKFTVKAYETLIKEGLTAYDILNKIPVFKTRIFWGSYIDKAMRQQELLTKREELTLISAPKMRADSFTVWVVKEKWNWDRVELWFLKDSISNEMLDLSNYRCIVNNPYNPDSTSVFESFWAEILIVNKSLI